MKVLIFFFTLLAINPGLAQDKSMPEGHTRATEELELVGELGEKLGTTFTVLGVIVDDFFKGYEGGPNLIVQIINDKPTQHLIQIPVSPYFGKFGEKPLPKVKDGSTYRFRVYETGEFVGVPADGYQESGIILQAPGFYFRNRLIVFSGEEIEAIEWTPDLMLEQNALLSGIAQNEKDGPIIQALEWKLRLNGFRKWTVSEIGKLVEAYGKVQKTETEGAYVMEKCGPRLVKLEDQIGKTVNLRGSARSLNGYWWFNYRGTDIYVEKMNELPNWRVENHWRPMEITGTLEQAQLPRIDQISLKSNRDLETYYIVRKASWSPIDELLTPELPLQN